ncbi:HK97 gp10 family phage protein [Paracraurococcus lichenis]|uniref:HK97 gp10 family phage protein n=1 Tax=Paracraurococcus lichenis TaxID=3064888 RepID=A0ABT9EDK7_9PROT|nr:HK97 gp10 family phage protein [Paracraurococcus sp. LOR1-02]MDO9714303.1 HK97 gp10 family phage protein [Paracraurococcus sp. LOR1-02]
MFKLDIEVPAYAIVYGKRDLRKALRAIGAIVARKARSLIRSSKESKPGLPPVSRTGALASSIKVRPSKTGDSVSVKDTKFYALFLEKGAVGGGGRKRTGRNKRGTPTTKRVLEPRPFLSVALEQTQAMIRAKLEQAVQNSITGGTK